MSPTVYFIIGCILGGIGVGLLAMWLIKEAVEAVIGRAFGW